MAGMHDVAREAGLKDEDVDKVFVAVQKLCKDGERVQVRNFGSFAQKVRAARIITSPKIPGGSAQVPERKVITFKASPATRENVEAKPAKKAKPVGKKPAKAAAEAAAE